MADSEKHLDDAKKAIRSLLLAAKDGETLRSLEKAHLELLGYPIPFKKLGYSSVQSMLTQVPDVCRKS